ncbi:hypothetical protein DICVIV_04585 [Dictyocaulus viviparus]|uniref:SXP/RAL-2 family protein Ani s 5-like cation-binding domain-containing protein n=1 Tax=Dictyocaulus viviparus TaxID=29172 RepID=A0A0D8XXA5_DICVI|nr:hypothetical protein DICVIV_04585 [Dictyocaulus viviparus]
MASLSVFDECNGLLNEFLLTQDDALTRGEREVALQSWAAKNNLTDEFDSYKNSTDTARNRKYEEIMSLLESLPEIFIQLQMIQTNPNFTMADEREATRELCSSLNIREVSVVNYILRLFSSSGLLEHFRFKRNALSNEIMRTFEVDEHLV